MVIVITVLCLLGILLGGGILMTFRDNERVHGRIESLEHKVNGLSGRVNTVARESKISHERLVDGLWRRASGEVDQEIKEARARGRDY
jgi:hypothetical protein